MSGAAPMLRALFLTIAERPARAALAMLPLPAVVLLVLFGGAFFGRTPFPPDGHAHIALGEAINARYCGRTASLSTRHNIGAAVAGDRRLLSLPFTDILILRAGSVDAYCRTVDLDFLNNENATGLLMRAALWVVPKPSPLRLSRFLGAVRLLCLLVFAFVLLRIGASLLFTTVAVAAAGQLEEELRIFAYSIYSFLVPLLLCASSAYAWALCGLNGRPAARLCGVSLAAGVLTAFCVNMRSSHLPLYVALFLVFLAAGAARVIRPRPWRLAAILVASLALYAGGYLAFNGVFIRPLAPQGPVAYHNYSHHVIAHPLVLSLAVPETEFSRREGITWNDAVGLDLARRMVPEAVYLGAGYEEGLFLYYIKLWLTQPDGMRQVYATKFRTAATGIFTDPRLATQPLAAVLRRIVVIRSGWSLLLLAVVCTVVASAVFWRWQQPSAFLILELGIVAVLVLLESAIIMSIYSAQYHAFLLMFFFMLVPLALQVLIDATARIVRARREAR